MASGLLLLVIAGMAVGAFSLQEWAIPAITLKSWALIIIAVTLHFLIEPLRWVRYLGNVNTKKLITTYHVLNSSALLSYAMPAKLGLPLRFLLIKRYLSSPAEIVATYMTLDSAATLAVWGLGSLIAASVLGYMPGDRFPQVSVGSGLIYVAIGVILSGILFAAWHRLRSFLHRLIDAVREIRSRVVLFAVVMLILDIGGYVLRHGLILQALGVYDLDWMLIAGITVASIFIGFISMMPMGLIGYDATITLLLMQHGVDASTALTVPVVNRLVNIMVSLSIGIPSMLALGLSRNALLNEVRTTRKAQ